MPKPARSGYKTAPSMDELRALTDGELRNLPKFEVSNEHGRIQFLPRDSKRGGIDITEVDLTDVEIKSKEVIVYGRFEKDQEGKPGLREKLNVPATISLKNIAPPPGRTCEQWVKMLKKNLVMASKMNEEDGDDGPAEFIAFDPSTYEWTFRVPHFTKWGIDVDEEKEDSLEQIPAMPNMPSAINSAARDPAKFEEEKEQQDAEIDVQDASA